MEQDPSEIPEDEQALDAPATAATASGGELTGLRLRDAVFRGRLGAGDLLAILLPLGEALSALHEAGRFHGGLTTDEVLIDEAGRPRLAEPAPGDERPLPPDGHWSAAYTAPERRGGGAPDAASDLYSLALAGMFLCHGFRLPPMAHEDPPRFARWLSCTDGARKVLERATLAEPEARFPSVAAFCEALAASEAPAPELELEGAGDEAWEGGYLTALEGEGTSEDANPAAPERVGPRLALVESSAAPPPREPAVTAPPEPAAAPTPPGTLWGRRAIATAIVVCLAALTARVASREDPRPAAPAAPTAAAPEPEAPPAPRARLQIALPGGVSLTVLPIDGGVFTMGSPEDQPGRAANQGPQRQVTLSPFWLGETESTQAQYSAVLGEAPSEFTGCGGDCPVERVSWADAARFANALSALEGLSPCYAIEGRAVTWAQGPACEGYRLPTEAEWEYAARAGRDTLYAGSDDIDEVAWYSRSSGDAPHPVAALAPNAWGLYDMSGNVWEWTWDYYAASYPAADERDPAGPPEGKQRVRRGGGWGFYPKANRVTFRARSPQNYSLNSLGFRIARSSTEPG